jgi:hypothetical protein
MFITGLYKNSDGSQSCCLKIYREPDKKELSFAFDNSLGAFGDKLSRIEVCIFPNKDSGEFEERDYGISPIEMAKIITKFTSGQSDILSQKNYKLWIGAKVTKVSKATPKPFKSTLRINTVKDVIDHPIRHEPAFTFEEDDSYVSCVQCKRV